MEDWLPALQRAAVWNGWSESDLLLQFAGHLRGKALLEWKLLSGDNKTTFAKATEALELGSKVLAAQDFRHLSQARDEPTSIHSFSD